jgi:NAD(P)-dependent dehydrogenase (short-subunit alcohol dehydrogenase family)
MSSTPITSGMLPDNTFKDHTVIITGGGTGLGKSMAYYLGQLGANLVICSRKQEVLKATAAELNDKTGAEVLPIACDVRDYLAVEKMINSVKEKFGNIHCFINNAAGNFVSPTERLSPKAFDVIVDIVLKGSYNSSLAMGKDWINSKQAGVFLNIVTTYAWTGSGYVVPSACAKAGVLALTRSLAVEWAKYSIRCNAIAPGPFPTEGAWTRLFPGELEKMFSPENKIPLKRYGEHQELANLAAYLLSGYSSYMTGEVVTIDGGEWLKGAGEFNMLDEVPSNMWDMMEKKRKR